MEITGWLVAFVFLFTFVLLSFPTWIRWWSTRRDVDGLPPLTNGRRDRDA